MKQSGFSLVEVLVGLGLLSVVTMTSLTLSTNMTNSIGQNDSKFGQVKLQKDMRDVLMKKATCVDALQNMTFRAAVDNAVAVQLADETIVSAEPARARVDAYGVKITGLDFVNKTLVSNVSVGTETHAIYAAELRLSSEALKGGANAQFAPAPIATLFVRVDPANQIVECLNAEDPRSLAQMTCGAIGGMMTDGVCRVLPDVTQVSCDVGQYMRGFDEEGHPLCKRLASTTMPPPPPSNTLGAGWPATRVYFGAGACNASCAGRYPGSVCGGGCHQSPLKWTWVECSDCRGM